MYHCLHMLKYVRVLTLLDLLEISLTWHCH